MKEPFDPEGKYFGFRFQTDYTSGLALVILTVKDGKTDDFWNPCDHVDFLDEVTERMDDQGMAFLVRNDVQKVYTPGKGDPWSIISAVDRFHTGTLSWHVDEEDWGVYRPLGESDQKWFQANGIRLEFIGNTLSS